MAVQQVLRRYRDTVFASIIRLLREHDERTQTKLEAVEASLRGTELSINHDQMQLLRETNERLKNSGTIQLSETELVTKIFSGLKMYLDPRDLAITPHLALDSIWEHRITAAWLSLIKPESTVFDIGANNGYYGALAAQIADKKKSQIVMFEANPHLIPYIKKTLAVNWLNEQTTVENVAIADREGEVTLHILKDYIGSSSVHDNQHVNKYMHQKMHMETAEEVKIPSTTIDHYCQQHNITNVDVMIMDIEGFEEKAYAGMRHTIKASRRPTLFIEFTPDSYEQPRALYETMLQDFGNVYLINDDGRLVKQTKTTYDAVIGEVDDWVMPVFSKDARLNERAGR